MQLSVNPGVSTVRRYGPTQHLCSGCTYLQKIGQCGVPVGDVSLSGSPRRDNVPEGTQAFVDVLSFAQRHPRRPRLKKKQCTCSSVRQTVRRISRIARPCHNFLPWFYRRNPSWVPPPGFLQVMPGTRHLFGIVICVRCVSVEIETVFFLIPLLLLQ